MKYFTSKALFIAVLSVFGAGLIPLASYAWGSSNYGQYNQYVTAQYWCGSYYSSYPCQNQNWGTNQDWNQGYNNQGWNQQSVANYNFYSSSYQYNPYQNYSNSYSYSNYNPYQYSNTDQNQYSNWNTGYSWNPYMSNSYQYQPQYQNYGSYYYPTTYSWY